MCVCVCGTNRNRLCSNKMSTTIIIRKMSTTTIEDLPNEVLLHIFAFFSFKDRIRHRLVCRNFRHLSFMNIRELCFGTKKLLNVYQQPNTGQLEIFHRNRFIQLEIFHTVLKESGPSLQRLTLTKRHGKSICKRFSADNVEHKMLKKKYFQLWRATIGTLISNCPRLEYLIVDKRFRLKTDIFMELLKGIGNQLTGLHLTGYTEDNKPPKYSEILTQFLNPNKLRELTIRNLNAKNFLQICRKFGKLTYLKVDCNGFKSGDFLDLSRLTDLRSLNFSGFENYHALNCLRDYGNYFQKLHTLTLYTSCCVSRFDSFHFLTSLRDLSIRIDACESLTKIITLLPLLESWRVRVDVPFFYSNFGDHFQNLDQLTQLKMFEIVVPFPKISKMNLKNMKPMPNMSTFKLEFRNFDGRDDLIRQLPRIVPNVKELLIWGIQFPYELVIRCLRRFQKLRYLYLKLDDTKKTKQFERYCRRRDIFKLEYTY